MYRTIGSGYFRKPLSAVDFSKARIGEESPEGGIESFNYVLLSKSSIFNNSVLLYVDCISKGGKN